MLSVVSHDKSWALMVDDLDTPAWVVSTKKKAIESARDAARHHECTLRIHTRSGKLQRERSYGGAHES